MTTLQGPSFARVIVFHIIALLCSNPLVVAARSSIKLGDELNSTSQLVSQGGNFTLGFFTVAATDYAYLGIWYTNEEVSNNDKPTKVWVANPNTPIETISGFTQAVLTIDSAGKLLIANGGRSILNITEEETVKNLNVSLSATLEDTGNFVLRDELEDKTVWQSFDHPTNVILPGMKLGVNHRTGQTWELTSWLSDQIPASGAFTLTWESTQASGELVMQRRGKRYWTSGPLIENNFKYMRINHPDDDYKYNLSFISNDDEKYFTFYAVAESSKSPMLVLSPNGGISVEYIELNFRVSPIGFCYGYEADNGCVISKLPECRSDLEKFEDKRASLGSKTSTIQRDSSESSLSDCMIFCWKYCSCIGFSSEISTNGMRCNFLTGSKEYRVDERGSVDLVYLLVSENSTVRVNKPTKGKKWIWAVIPIAGMVVLIIGLCCLRKRKLSLKGEEKRKQEKYLLELTTSEGFIDPSDEGQFDGRKGHDVKIYSFDLIMVATNNFSDENKLGVGGFGSVYKGKLHDMSEIAIKRLSRTSGQGLVEFKNELILITKLQHTNLVRVLGCCIHGDEKMLIYEYMPNRSLDFFLFDAVKRAQLDWQKRVSIIEGVAQGLLYLHKYSRMRVIHRDLKAGNVLLDEDMRPKISDFGMARIFWRNETEAKTKRVVGTYGYMSPEYAMQGTFSMKSDVFSFGVLMLEIVSGRRNNSFYHIDLPFNLIAYAWQLWKEGEALKLTDLALENYELHVRDQLYRTIHIGLLCVQENAKDRPTMSAVVSMLGSETIPLQAPNQPAFITGRSVPGQAPDKGNSKECSISHMSVSAMDAR
ncbi:Receptor-like serine/threonine-protein kinase [Heracleum sosnowskyi]|uniref:Receptor-like serine/threonine-protein kinase n=1 Tax=Heracleum sosnowskyi TaxID=360622 RepID=A0AAD8HZY9_9APIA|nr:Receptor-like serine/threonine-protein kinase [Heracleum sosnowskyi]